MAFLSRRAASLFRIGICLSTDPSRAAQETNTPILASVCSTARHWPCRQLTQLGRLHVAKQVLASRLTDHATFVRPTPYLLEELMWAFFLTHLDGLPQLRCLQDGNRFLFLTKRTQNMESRTDARQATSPASEDCSPTVSSHTPLSADDKCAGSRCKNTPRSRKAGFHFQQRVLGWHGSRRHHQCWQPPPYTAWLGCLAPSQDAQFPARPLVCASLGS